MSLEEAYGKQACEIKRLTAELEEAKQLYQSANDARTKWATEAMRYKEALEEIVKKDYHSITNNTHGMFGWIAKQALDREDGNE